MRTLNALRESYWQELGEDGYLDSPMVRRIMEALEAYADEAEMEDSTPPDDLRQWAAILNAAADKIEGKEG